MRNNGKIQHQHLQKHTGSIDIAVNPVMNIVRSDQQ